MLHAAASLKVYLIFPSSLSLSPSLLLLGGVPALFRQNKVSVATRINHRNTDDSATFFKTLSILNYATRTLLRFYGKSNATKEKV